MRETEIEKKFRQEVTRFGGVAYKLVSPGHSGMPDRLVLFPEGISGFVELKAPGRKPRREQELRIRELREKGFPALVVDNVEDIQTAIWTIRHKSNLDLQAAKALIATEGVL